MNFQNLLNQFTGSSSNSSSTRHNTKSSGLGLGSGLMGGAAAGGVMGLLVGSKKGRKFAGKAATVGGAALIGGIAFKAYKNWQQKNQQTSAHSPENNLGDNSAHNPAAPPHYAGDKAVPQEVSQDFQLTLIKAMIGAKFIGANLSVGKGVDFTKGLSKNWEGQLSMGLYSFITL